MRGRGDVVRPLKSKVYINEKKKKATVGLVKKTNNEVIIDTKSISWRYRCCRGKAVKMEKNRKECTGFFFLKKGQSIYY